MFKRLLMYLGIPLSLAVIGLILCMFIAKESIIENYKLYE